MAAQDKTPKESSRSHEPKRLEFKVDGVLDREFSLPKVPSEALEEIAVDWQSLQYVNSTGIVAWLKWVHEVRQAQPGVRFVFSHCPIFLVHIMNSVKGFLPKNSSVTSFAIPFQCEKCGKGDNRTLVLSIDKDKPVPTTVEEVRERLVNTVCTTGDCEIELDVSPTFFSFLKNLG